MPRYFGITAGEVERRSELPLKNGTGWPLRSARSMKLRHDSTLTMPMFGIA